MNRMFSTWIVAAIFGSTTAQDAASAERDFAGDVEFLRKHTDIIILGDEPNGPRVAVAPAWQGRVMTSTAAADSGLGYGWINDELIASGQTGPHINVWGGEDRFWMGPEGGQFAIFFKKGDRFDLEHWQTPAVIDTEPFEVVKQDARHATFIKETRLTNFSGTEFDVRIERTVRLIDADAAGRVLGVKPASKVRMVAYESLNAITNVGSKAWTRDTGMLSIWILGMFKPGDQTTVAIPFVSGDVAKLGPIVNDAYFGKVPPDRLKIDSDTLYFRGDGRMRSKIGLSKKRSKPVLGSYDARRGVLTIVTYTLPPEDADYVNSMWEMQKDPFAGDVVNSYNDGPPAPGKKPLGPFYELETSSPAASLKPGQTLKHTHSTFHFEGPEANLSEISIKTLGIELGRIQDAFGP